MLLHVPFDTLKQEAYTLTTLSCFCILPPVSNAGALPCQTHTHASGGKGRLVLLQEISEASLKLCPRNYKCSVREGGNIKDLWIETQSAAPTKQIPPSLSEMSAPQTFEPVYAVILIYATSEEKVTNCVSFV